jgi:uncharacterized protein YyaL (SSP411 family)
VNATALEWIADTIVRQIAHGHVSPSSAIVLLNHYAAHPRDDVRDAIEAALTTALTEVAGTSDPCARCRWLGVLADASAWSDDERLPQAVQSSLATTVEDLESLVRSVYEPGEGLLGRSLADQMQCAAALVTAFELTGRLPYSMLAEELVQTARKHLWSTVSAGFPDDLISTAVAIQLFCRLEALHRDADYAAAAVVARDESYEADAAAALAALDGLYRQHPDAAAEYGVALINWFALTGHPN